MQLTSKQKTIIAIVLGTIAVLGIGYIGGTLYGQGSAKLLAYQLAQSGFVLEGQEIFLHENDPTPRQLSIGMRELAFRLTKGLKEHYPLNASIDTFSDLEGFASNFTRFVEDRLATLLAQHEGITLESRDNTLISLQGKVSDLGDQVDIDVKVVNRQTNDVLYAVAVPIGKDEHIALLLEQDRIALVPKDLPTISSPLAKTLNFRFPQTVNRGDLDFSLDSCSLGELFVRCRVRAFNNGDSLRNLFIYMDDSYLVDVEGRRYRLQSVEAVGSLPEIKGKIYQRGGWDFPPATRIGLNFEFLTKDFPPDVKIASIVIRFGSYPGGRGFPDTPFVVFTN